MLEKFEETPVLEQFQLTDQVALVTGAARGIGLVAAKALAEAGASVAITYNSSSKTTVNAAIETLKKTGCPEVQAYQVDVAQKADITNVVNRVFEEFGRLDIVVPNAGVAVHEPAEEFSEESYYNQMTVNLDGAFFTAQAAANVFKKQKAAGSLKQGRIVFTASVSSQIVNFPQKQAPYNASKAGLVRLAKCLAVEWMDFARVNCISPGYIDTDMLSVHPKEWTDKWFSLIPADRLCATHELKGAYVFMAANTATYMTGTELVIDGAFTLV
jgi:sorbose reductase